MGNKSDFVDIDFVDCNLIHWTDLKPGNIFSKAIDSTNDSYEMYLTISFNNVLYYVRLSDAKVFDKTLFPPDNLEHYFDLNSRVQRHLCTITVEM